MDVRVSLVGATASPADQLLPRAKPDVRGGQYLVLKLAQKCRQNTFKA